MNIPDGFAQANLIFSGAAVPLGAQMTLGLNVELYPGSPTAAAGDIGVAWSTANLDNRQVDGISLSGVLVKFGPNSTGPSALVAFSTPGTIAQDGVTPAVSVLVHKTTEFGGRTGRGRMYMPGISDSTVLESGLIDGATVTALEVAWDAFYTELVTAGLVPVLLHSPGSPVTIPLPITNFTVDSRVATQRRRNRR